MNEEYFDKLARLTALRGVNAQPSQTIVLNSPIEAAPLARKIARYAYEAGAREVIVNYSDAKLNHDRYLMADPDVFNECPDWKADFYNQTAEDGASYISITGNDPNLMKDINPSYRILEMRQARLKQDKYRKKIETGEAAWTIVPFAHPDWAKSVFPDLEEGQAIDALWNDIFQICRIDENDPIENWNRHHESFKKRIQKLNNCGLKSLHYTNSLGTDLIIELPEGYLFADGASIRSDGLLFFPNIPTEEVFTAPLKTGVNGRVVASMPLNVGGKLIEEFEMTFKDGKVVSFSAKEGEETLKEILNTDENSCYLGEVALVPADSPIQSLNRIFYNTLIDENASCHLALGQSYGECIENGLNLESEELEKLGMNQSAAHTDFMIGTEDLSIVGTLKNGEIVPVFENGRFSSWIDEENKDL